MPVRKTVKKSCSLCLIGRKVPEAGILEEEGKIRLVRTCPGRGKFRYVSGSDPEMCHRFERYLVSDELRWIHAEPGVDHLFSEHNKNPAGNQALRSPFFPRSIIR